MIETDGWDNTFTMLSSDGRAVEVRWNPPFDRRVRVPMDPLANHARTQAPRDHPAG